MARLNAHTRRLHAAHSAQQERTFAAVGSVQRHVDASLRRLWSELLAVLRVRHGPHADYLRLLAVLRKVGAVTAGTLRTSLAGLYARAYGGAADSVLRTLPTGVLRRAAGNAGRADAGLRAGGLGAVLGGPQRQGGHHLLAGRALESVHACCWGGGVELTEAGLVSLLPSGGFEPSPLIAPLTQQPPPDRAGQLDLFRRLLFAPPEESSVLSWLDRFVRPEAYGPVGTDAHKRMPEDIAAQMAGAMARGETQREIAKGLRPLFDGSRVRAQRAARTFGLYTAGQAQNAIWSGLGDMQIGFQVFSAKVPDSRKWHVQRDGNKYYFDPRPGQLGMDLCPDPPLEPPNPAARPAGTPQMAWQCLCYRVPLLRDV